MYLICKRLYTNSNFVAAKEIYRNFARRRPVANPGIQKQKELVEDDVIDLEDCDFALESDFMNVGNTYADHVKEIEHYKKREQLQIVKRKYFKENAPNFLSWSEKEQIRYLHRMDPEEWCVENLSQGFPALPEVITKILKATWTKKSEAKIQNHDNSVKKNWMLFKDNKLTNLNPKLVEHLHKFTHRPTEASNPITLPTTTEGHREIRRIRTGNEFSSIISSYEHLKNKTESTGYNFSSNSTKPIENKPRKGDTYLLDGPKSSYSKHITLNALEGKIQQKSLQGTPLTDDEILLQQATQQFKESTIKQPINKMIPANMYKSNTTKLVTVHKPKDNYLLEYPQKITIPANKLKKGCTYKLNDCYYDDDGLFLYRVPGMYK